MFRILLSCCLLFALAACQVATAIAPTATPTPAPTQTPEPTATPIPARPTFLPDPFTAEAQVGEYKLKINCEGSGEPTLILENGTDSLNFENTPPFTTTRQCTYARAGMNGEMAKGPRTSLDQVKDLHSLLEQTGVPGPYILMGRGTAVINLVLYANQYPEEVVGMVCVDCRHPAFLDILLEKVKPLIAADPDFETKYGNTIKQESLEKDPNSWKNMKEQVDFGTSYAQLLQVASLGDIPFIVLVSENRNRVPTADPTYAFSSAFWQAWGESNEILSKLSTQGRIEVVPGTMLGSLEFHPAVKKAVQEVYAKVKK